MAFAGSDVEMVTLPYSVKAVGHKAFFGCDKLTAMVFKSYDAPILEEEFDSTYYEALTHIPGTGDYGTYTDYDGSEVNIIGTGMLPYYMWNATDGMYSNVFYGANFVDYVGYVDNKLVMVRPSNGQHYETYILSQYFRLVVDGNAAADDVTLAAIAAINAIPEKVSYSDKHLVEAAREAYNKIATLEQQSLVKNYEVLVSAEQRIVALTPTDEPIADEQDNEKGLSGWIIALIAAGGALVAGGGVAAAVLLFIRKRKGEGKAKAKAEPAAEAVTEPEAEIVAEPEAESENAPETEEISNEEIKDDAENETEI